VKLGKGKQSDRQKKAPRKRAEPRVLRDSKQDGTAKLKEKPAVAEKQVVKRQACFSRTARSAFR